jgi:hypothetical protein
VLQNVRYELFLRDLHNDWFALTFAPLREPRCQPFGKALRSQAKAGFDSAVCHRQGIVEIGGIREIAHAELIEPIEWAGAAFTANNDIYF